MAKINFVQGKFESFLDSGAVNDGGDVALFTADGTFSTPKTTYTTFALTTPNAPILNLDAAGRATLYFEGDADVRVRDSAGATIYTQRNVNPSVSISSYLYSTAQSLTGVHAESMVEVTGTTTISLTAATTLGEGWRCHIKNTGTGIVTIARLAGGDKINGTAANITLPVGSATMIAVSDLIDGFNTYGINLVNAEGTWTPVLRFGGGTTGIAYLSQEGTYTRIGRIIFYHCLIILTSKGSSTGAATVAGLPFPSASSVGSDLNFTASMTFTGQMGAGITQATSVIDLYEMTEAGVSTTIDDTNFTNNSGFRLSGNYFV